MKVSPPAASSSQVIRQGVCRLLSASASPRLVLVRAPAGFGKTTAMLQHRARLEQASVSTAWFTLDSADNDPVRFLQGFKVAIATVVGDDAFSDTGFPQSETLGEAALRVMNVVAGLKKPFAIFLDDFEVLQDPSVVAWIREFIDHLPHGGQLVIGSRSLPDLRMGRLRARGQLVEIDAHVLRFSLDETDEFFRIVQGASLPQSELARLHNKTEGWAAALWLASASLRRNDSHADFINRFSGTNRSVADYLTEDVFAQQSEPVRRFLLRTSILRYLSVPLCQRLLPDMDCEPILNQLEASSLIALIDSEDRTWRYHSLIAEFLKAQLQRDAPDDIPRLHRVASDWYLNQRRPVPAIDHALEGSDFPRAVDLLEKFALPLLAQGRMRLLSRWFDALPAQILYDHPMLLAARIWSVNFTRGPWEAMELLESSRLQEVDDPQVRPHVLALRPVLLAMMDRSEKALEVGRECLKHCPTGSVFADMMLANVMANQFAVAGQRSESRRLLEMARRSQGTDFSAFNIMYSETIEAIFDLQEGRLREATARLRIAVASGSSHHDGYTGGNAWAGLMYAATVYETNDLAQAAHLLQVYVPLARDVLLPDHVMLGHVMQSRVAFARGDVDEAFEILTQLEYLGHVRRLTRMTAGAKLERARILLMQGHHRAAQDELARAEDPELWSHVGQLHLIGNDLDYLELAKLRWEALAGDAQAVVSRLNKAAELADQEARHRRAMKLRLLAAIAAHRAEDPIAAQSILDPVLKAACREGFVRLLLDEGEQHVGPLLRQFSRSLDVSGAASSDPILADYILRLGRACGLADEPITPATADQPKLLDPLTPKEIRVLQLLAEGYSNQAIAEKLFVSESTVRTHLRNINNKVSAHSRTQAVAIARKLGLIG
ncbi:LuxR C-terminal-related transcriptional regulator [Burkholderia sp. AU30198]|nr:MULTISPECIES: LuxR C-terminal-related transcriptional regulator [Burkholderia]MCA8299081.1 LuxR C-terminal-related transcriptional regulator [Burkholderia sp. AU30198]